MLPVVPQVSTYSFSLALSDISASEQITPGRNIKDQPDQSETPMKVAYDQIAQQAREIFATAMKNYKTEHLQLVERAKIAQESLDKGNYTTLRTLAIAIFILCSVGLVAATGGCFAVGPFSPWTDFMINGLITFGFLAPVSGIFAWVVCSKISGLKQAATAPSKLTMPVQATVVPYMCDYDLDLYSTRRKVMQDLSQRTLAELVNYHYSISDLISYSLLDRACLLTDANRSAFYTKFHALWNNFQQSKVTKENYSQILNRVRISLETQLTHWKAVEDQRIQGRKRDLNLQKDHQIRLENTAAGIGQYPTYHHRRHHRRHPHSHRPLVTVREHGPSVGEIRAVQEAARINAEALRSTSISIQADENRVKSDFEALSIQIQTWFDTSLTNLNQAYHEACQVLELQYKQLKDRFSVVASTCDAPVVAPGGPIGVGVSIVPSAPSLPPPPYDA